MRFVLLLMCTTGVSQWLHAETSMVDQVEAAIVKQTNTFREKHELPPVEEDSALTKTASKFAKFMAESGTYGHHADGKSPAQRAKESGYEYCVVRENIAYRTNTGEITAEGLIGVFVQGWIDSPPHRENMLADYVTQTGVAVATSDQTTYYAVQLFGRPKSAAIRLKIENESDEPQTLHVEANDSADEIEMPPRTVLTMTRCFPTTLRVQSSDSEVSVNESVELTITEDGVIKE